MLRDWVKKRKVQIWVVVILFAVQFFGNDTFADNPVLSNYMFNMSMGTEFSSHEDHAPEMVIDGNFIHSVWTSNTGGDDAYLYYRRSEDLGKTWGAPQKLARFANWSYATHLAAVRLAVSSSQVHISYSDNSNGGRLYYLKSSDNGLTFSQPQELEPAGSGFNVTNRTFIRSRGNQVAIAYQVEWWNNANKGIYCQVSTDGGQTFTRKLVTEENTSLVDFDFDGQTMALLLNYAYYYYGLNVGRVHVASSVDLGNSFAINKVSVTYDDEWGTQERCLVAYDNQYVPKIRIDGASIHTIFTGNNEKGVWSVLYARSMNKGQSFEKAVDINSGAIGNQAIQNGHESVEAFNGHVYLQFLTKSSKVWLAHSSNFGSTISELKSILPTEAYYGQSTWFPRLAIDYSDATGKTVYLGGSRHLTYKSNDGGENFWGIYYLSPMMTYETQASTLSIDPQGNPHWLSKGRYGWGNGWDVFYARKQVQPEPGSINKSYKIRTTANDRKELAMVPSSETMEFDSVLTAEAWVKINAGGGLSQNVLTKINGNDGVHWEDPGFQLSFDNNYGKRRFRAGISTDKGGFINWTGTDVQDTLWHHVAFTYDADEGIDNFKAYIDGQLIAQQTVTGRIVRSDGILLIGSRNAFSHESSSYEVDEIRLWRRALSQEELIENQTKKFTGNEEALMLYLNFDGTFKDISGNGNDAIPVCMGELKVSDFDPPIPAFDLYHSVNQVSLNNKTQNATAYNWIFGDGNVSTLGNPTHVYSTPNNYVIMLEAQNANSKTLALNKVNIAGLDRIEPVQAGNGGFATITVFGGNLTDQNTSLLLRREGEPDILGENIVLNVNGSLSAHFNLNAKSVGKWSFVVVHNGSEQVLDEVFTLVQAVLPDPWVSVSGRGAILFNMWQKYTINYGNNGNVDGLGVPLYIAVSDHPDVEIELIDFEIAPNEYMKTNFPEVLNEMDSLFYVVDNYFDEGHSARIYPLIIPILEANSSHSIQIRVKSNRNISIETWTMQPYFETDQTVLKSTSDDWPDEKTKLNACIALNTMNAAQSVASDLAGMVLPIDCVNDAITVVFKPWDKLQPEQPNKRKTFFNSELYGWGSAMFSCAADLTPYKAIKIGMKIANAINNMVGGYYANEDCRRAFDPRYKNRLNVSVVSSFDPNEMIGPAGFGAQNWIAKANTVPYTILFENKSSASAPAHMVTIADTLDRNVFDFNEFGFGEFGFGDTILSPMGNNLKSFSLDVDLRPRMNLIARVSAQLDTLSGLAKWEFLSLNPETMELEEDPFIGFLPPNNADHAGEGFVSFFVGVQPTVATNTELKNKAQIIFDANAPIVTNEYLNTFDLDEPQSQIEPLNPQSFTHVNLKWGGNDAGSGIRSYSIYVLEDDSLFYSWKLNTEETEAYFKGKIGSTYRFYSIATDQVSLVESKADSYDAHTEVITSVEQFSLTDRQLQVAPVPATDFLNLKLLDAANGVYFVQLLNLQGQEVYGQLKHAFDLNSGISIDIRTLPEGPYYLRILSGNRTINRAIVVRK